MELTRSPADKLARLLVQSDGGHLMQRAMVQAQVTFRQTYPYASTDEFATWVGEPCGEAGYPRIFQFMTEQHARLVLTESTVMVKAAQEIGKQVRFDPAVDLPEKFPGVKRMQGKISGDANQCKSRNVLQNHPEVLDGDQFHIVEAGVGMNPSGQPYSDARDLTHVFPLRAKFGSTEIFASLGGTTDLVPVDGKETVCRAANSIGHHVRTLDDIKFPVQAVTMKLDGVQLRLVSEGKGKGLFLRSRNGKELKLRASGATLNSVDISLEAVRFDGTYWNGESVAELMANSDIYITHIGRLNYENIFGYEMILKARGRLTYNSKSLGVPPFIWKKGSTIPFLRTFSDNISTLKFQRNFSFDGVVVHTHPSVYTQNLLKALRTADVTKQMALELGMPWPPGAKGIWEFAIHGQNGSDGFVALRARPDKDKPNNMANIKAMMMSPDATMGLNYIANHMVEQSMDKLLTEGGDIMEGLGFTQGDFIRLFQECGDLDEEYGLDSFYFVEAKKLYWDKLPQGEFAEGRVLQMMAEMAQN